MTLAAILLLTSCAVDELSQSWQLDRTRILAVRATVTGATDTVLGTRAEPSPGDNVRFESLTYAPSDESIGGILWSVCVPEDPRAAGCELKDSDEEDTGKDDQISGIIGFEPLLPPEWDVPETALDSLSQADQKEGLTALVNLIVLSEEQLDDMESKEAKDDLDDDLTAYEMAYKRVPVSNAETPNHNPDIYDFIVAGTALNGAEGFTARSGKIYTIEPILAPGHVETYAFTNSSGVTEYRAEQPYFDWYTEKGKNEDGERASFDQEFTLHPFTTTEWTAPESAGPVTLHIVVRDRRGGMGWASLSVNVLE
jgi:hypothetical protein